MFLAQDELEDEQAVMAEPIAIIRPFKLDPEERRIKLPPNPYVYLPVTEEIDLDEEALRWPD